MADKRKAAENRTTLRWVLKHLNKRWASFSVLVLLQSLSAVAGVLLALAVRSIVDAAVGVDKLGIIYGVIALGALVGFQYLCRYISSRLSNYISVKLNVSFRGELASFLYNAKYSGVSAFHSGELMNRFTTDVEVVTSGVTGLLPSAITMVVRIVCAGVVLFVLSPELLLISLAIGALVGLGMLLFRNKLKTLQRGVRESEGKVRSFMQESIVDLPVIKAFSASPAFLNRLYAVQDVNAKNRIRHNRFTSLAGAAIGLCFTLAYMAALTWGAFSIYTGAFTYGTLTAVLQLVSQVRTPLAGLSQVMPQYYSTLVSAERLMSLLRLESDAQEPLPKEVIDDFQRLDVNDVCFEYSNGQPVLENVSFSVERGQSCVISGLSGIGKSTIVKLLLSLYSPCSGGISFVCGSESYDLSSSARGLFAYVPQGNMLFGGSIRDNITMYDGSIPDERILEACRLACADGFIAKMPDGLASILSEGGKGVSEGQAQRIAIARALLCDAPILLLDEAASSLDASTERQVLENLKALGKTCIMISHRSVPDEYADIRLKVENRRITMV